MYCSQNEKMHSSSTRASAHSLTVKIYNDQCGQTEKLHIKGGVLCRVLYLPVQMCTLYFVSCRWPHV